MNNSVRKAADLIAASQGITILTGAGVSKESGVPTFRDAMEGLWARFDPQQLATPSAFMENPKLVWEWYEYRREMVRRAQPNPGHLALAELERRFPVRALITQNVDDLHEQAGSQQVIHLHGKIAGNRCFYNCQGEPTMVDVEAFAWDRTAGPPPCPYCGRWVRPDVVWFGESLPTAALEAAVESIRRSDVMIVIGTSGVVQPAASLAVTAHRAGAAVIEVNPDETPISPIAQVRLVGPSGQLLPQVIAALDEEKST
jgi:NAD-dependent deacetylase